MRYRFLIVAILAIVPVATQADVSSGSSAGTSSQSAATSELGPATSAANTGSSSADGSALQPADNNPLQSTTDGSNSLTAPNSNALQAPAASTDQLSVINDGADGPPHQLGSPSPWVWIVTSVLIALIAVGSWWLWRRRRPGFASASYELEALIPETPIKFESKANSDPPSGELSIESEAMSETETLKSEDEPKAEAKTNDEPLTSDTHRQPKPRRGRRHSKSSRKHRR